MGEWPFTVDPSLPFAMRVRQVAIGALADGTLSKAKRLAFHRAFMACGGNETLIPINGTTCAMWAGAVWHWAGRRVRLPRYRTPTSITSWLDGLSGSSPSWRSFGRADCVPCVGAIFYVEADSNPLNNHVGVLVEELAHGVWLCAEGGQGDGSEARFTVRRWGPTWDARRLRGLWLPQFADRVGDPPPPPGVALPDFPIVPGDTRRDTVTRWQKRLLARTPGCLPRYGADGGYGAETIAATKALQVAASLPVTGSCDLATWEECGP